MTNKAGDAPLVTRVHQNYANLSQGERRVADRILDYPGEFATHTAVELAQLCQVSSATISRFVRRLGYRDYDQARRSARDAQTWGSPVYRTSPKDDGAKTSQDSIARFLADEAGNLQATFDGLNAAELKKAIAAMTRARRLFFLGFRNSSLLASLACNQFMRFRKNVFQLNAQGETLAERLAELDKGDVVVVVALRRLHRQLDEYVSAARDRGARIVLISDPSIRTLPARADWSFVAAVESSQAFDCYAGAVALLRLLAVEVLHLSGRDGRQRLQAVEDLHERLDEFGNRRPPQSS